MNAVKYHIYFRATFAINSFESYRLYAISGLDNILVPNRTETIP